MVYLTLQQSLGLLYFFYVVFFLRKAFLDYGPSSEKIEAFLSHMHECIDEFLRSGDPNYYEHDNEDQESEKTEKTENLEKSEKKESEPKKPTRFEDKYLEEYKNLEDVELDTERLDSLKSNIIMENTPIGNVVMFYDNKKENNIRIISLLFNNNLSVHVLNEIFDENDIKKMGLSVKFQSLEESIDNEIVNNTEIDNEKRDKINIKWSLQY
jgi:hypothetical protein